jgi:hypothetical protein
VARSRDVAGLERVYGVPIPVEADELAFLRHVHLRGEAPAQAAVAVAELLRPVLDVERVLDRARAAAAAADQGELDGIVLRRMNIRQRDAGQSRHSQKIPSRCGFTHGDTLLHFTPYSAGFSPRRVIAWLQIPQQLLRRLHGYVVILPAAEIADVPQRPDVSGPGLRRVHDGNLDADRGHQSFCFRVGSKPSQDRFFSGLFRYRAVVSHKESQGLLLEIRASCSRPWRRLNGQGINATEPWFLSEKE